MPVPDDTVGKPADGEGASKVLALAPEQAKRWRTKLYKTDGKNPKVKNVIANGIVALRWAPEWRGALRYDENAQNIRLERQPPDPWPQGTVPWVPRTWKEQDDGLLSEWLTRHGVDLSPNGASESALIVARESSFHPIRDYLNSLKWDGKPRTASWLVDFLGADPNENGEYLRVIGQRWLISGVGRVMQPGCKADHTLIIEGLQGVGKGSLLRELCPVEKWFTDQNPDLNDYQNAALMLEGKWIVELAELDAFKGATQERLKSYLTRRDDHIRRPWGRRFEDIPRQCIFAGSTNKDGYLTDETGNRRYWPFKATKLDVAGLRAARDQLWAEAKALYDSGVPNWLDTLELQQLAEEAQDQRFDVDLWEEKVQGFVEGRSEVSTSELLHAIIDEREITRADQMRVAKILRHLKFERAFRKEKGRFVRFYKRIVR